MPSLPLKLPPSLASRFAGLGIGWLFALALLPGLLTGTILFYDLYRHERSQLEEGALQTARALSHAIDRDLAGIQGKLRILATSPALEHGRLADFDRQARQALATESLASAIVLIDPGGQQIINTLRPFGAPLPRTGHPEVVRRTVESGQPRVSNFYIGGVSRLPAISVEVPVWRQGRVAYALDMGIPAARLNQWFLAENLPAGWEAALLDARGTVVARSINPEGMVGRRATPDLLAAMAQAPEGSKASQTLEGVPSFAAYTRSSTTGLTVVVAMTRNVLHANLHRPLLLAALTSLAFILGGGLLARLAARHVRESLRTVEAAAEASAAGRVAAVAPFPAPREISRLAEQFNAMQAARRRAEAEQARLNGNLRLLSESSSALLHADQEEQLLPEICRLIVEEGGYVMAWVGQAEHNAEKTVKPVAQSGYEEGYLDSIRVTWADNDLGRGPTGTAIRSGRPCINQNVLTNPALRPWRTAAVQRGYQSSIGLPLVMNGVVVAALTIYAKEPDAFGAEEIQLLEQLASNLAFGIERLRTRSQLAIANKELQGFTYAASHDMRAPLTRIVNFSALLERQYRDRLEGDGLLFLDFIRQNASRLTALIDDLLDHAQIEQLVLELEPLDLAAAVAGTRQELQGDIDGAGALVRVDVPPLLVDAHPLALAQVLRNLLGNALKYAGDASPPVIEIGAVRDGGSCRLWVRDNGVGFDMAYHDRIFEIFRRLHTYAEIPGSGVGLALVRKAMERMGGRVWAESGPGEGATFFIELKLARPPQPAAAEVQEETA